MTEQEPTLKEYNEAIFRAVNYGIDFQNSREADMFIRVHMDAMAQEKKDGYPKGMVCWEGYMQLLRQALVKRDLLRAKERHSNKVWTPYVIR